MKLISVYIENFGGLSRYELDFESGLTVINQPNGFGKTTLAEFIRAMFFGFPRKVKTLEKSRRQRYAPWNGGSYGGNLTFEHEGQRYRMERTFGATPKGDTFTLIDLGTNRKSIRFSEEIGIELFGLDSDSFERCTYLPQMHEDSLLSTAAIQAKLTALVEDGGDVANFDKAIAALKAKRSALIPYRGGGGTVAEATGKIAELQMQLDHALRQHDRLSLLQENTARTDAELERTQAALAQVRQELSAASEAAAVAMRRDQYGQLQRRYSQVSARTVDLQNKYSAGFPDVPSLTSAEAAADRLAVLENQVITTQADLQAQKLLRDNARFATHLPEQEELDACRRNCGKYDELQDQLRTAQLAAAELVQKEGQNLPIPQRKNNLIGLIAVWIVCVLCLASGAALMFMQEFLYGGIALGTGLAALGAALFLLHGRRKQQAALVQERRQNLEQQLAVIQQKTTESRHAQAQCRAAIERFLSPYFGGVEPQHFLACLTRLEHNVQRYAQAQRQVSDWQVRKEKQEAALASCRGELKAFFFRYGLEMSEDVRAQLRQLRDDMRDARALLAQKQELADQLTQFKHIHGQMIAAPSASAEDVETLKAEEQRLRQTLTELTSSLLRRRQEQQELRTEVSEIPQLREELERWQQKKAEDRENARILDDTMDFLQKAKDNLSASYLGAIQSRFGYYLSMLEEKSDGKFFIDADFQVQLERMGHARELAYFSAGQTDLVMLCMRLALVDALFRGQETFVILDDPFVNLDDVHTAQALELLRTLSSGRQILYLTCHTSRALLGKSNCDLSGNPDF